MKLQDMKSFVCRSFSFFKYELHFQINRCLVYALVNSCIPLFIQFSLESNGWYTLSNAIKEKKQFAILQKCMTLHLVPRCNEYQSQTDSINIISMPKVYNFFKDSQTVLFESHLVRSQSVLHFIFHLVI